MKKIAMLVAVAGLISNITLRAADKPAVTDTVKVVLTNYITIQLALADDTMKGVTNSANALVKAVMDDKEKNRPKEVAEEAEDLLAVKDLAAAREAFKPLSDSLIKYLADHPLKSETYDEVFCPMQNASWLQKGEQVKKPLFGPFHAGVWHSEADILTLATIGLMRSTIPSIE